MKSLVVLEELKVSTAALKTIYNSLAPSINLVKLTLRLDLILHNERLASGIKLFGELG
jgi:hypothetical protein